MATIEDAMNGEYANAKACFRLVTFVQVALMATAVGAILANSSNAVFAALATFIGPVALFVLREVGSHFYGKGERIRRIYLLQSGLDRKPSESDLLDIFERASERSKYEPPPIGGYYEKGGVPGVPKLLLLLQQSAFWTSAQARTARNLHYVVSTTGLVITALLVSVALRHPTAAGQLDLSKVFFVLLSFFVTGTFTTSARSFGALGEAAGKVVARADALRREAQADPIELYKVLSAYDSALTKALPIPGYIYRARQNAIQRAWDAVGAGRPPST